TTARGKREGEEHGRPAHAPSVHGRRPMWKKRGVPRPSAAGAANPTLLLEELCPRPVAVVAPDHIAAVADREDELVLPGDTDVDRLAWHVAAHDAAVEEIRPVRGHVEHDRAEPHRLVVDADVGDEPLVRAAERHV